MVALIVIEQGARLTIDGTRYVVELKGRAIRTAVTDEVDRIVLFGGVELTSACIRRVLAARCDLTFFTRDGRFRGRLQGPRSPNVQVRVAQVRALHSADTRLLLGKRFVHAKLRNQRSVLLRAQRSLGDPQLAQAIARVRNAEKSLDRVETMDALRGVEGAGSAGYFAGLGGAIRNPDFAFSGRNRRPPRDPINACLSFGYAVLAALVTDACERVGLDPMVGALHDVDHGRPSLALDLMEEWRPVLVDSLVLRLVNRRQLTPSDFGPLERDIADDVLADREIPSPEVPDAISLRPTGRRIVLAEWLRRLRERVAVPDRPGSWRYDDVVEFQARRLARFFQDPTAGYVGFTTR